MQSRILIIGGAGFIGCHLIQKLKIADPQAEILVYDEDISYTKPSQSYYARIKEERQQAIAQQVTLVRGNILDRAKLETTVHNFQPTCIGHLAAVPLAHVGKHNPQLVVETNVNGLLNILYALQSNKAPSQRFIFISSSYAYGNFQSTIADEDDSPNPIDIYGSSKLAGEILVRSFCSSRRIEYVIVRPSAVYGPYDTNERIVQICIERALAGLPLHLHANSSALDFTYVEDLAEGLVLTIFTPGAANEVFNLTYGKARTLEDLAESIKKILPSVGIEYTPSDFNRPKRGTLNIEKAKNILGYTPRYQLEEGIAKYITFYKEMIAKGPS